MMMPWKWAILHFWSRWLIVELRFRGVEIGRDVEIFGKPDVRMQQGCRIQIGDHARICSAIFANPLRPQTRTSLHAMEPGAEIVIAAGAGISSSTFVARRRIEVGEGAYIGADCLIVDNDFHSLDPVVRGSAYDVPATRSVEIGKRAFIGTRSIILKGVIIGENTVVGAGSVVANSLPANVVAAGNPARVIRPLGDRSH